jgi:Carboxypeptidase regulatory-like domain
VIKAYSPAVSTIQRGTRLIAICTIAASAVAAWLPAAAASAATAAPAGRTAAGSPPPAHRPATPATRTSAPWTAAEAAATAAAATAATTAQTAASAGALAGTVVGPAGIPLAGICVTATGTGTRQATRTDAAGQYAFTGLKPGYFSLGYTACASPGSYASEAYPAGRVDVTSAEPTLLEPVPLTAATTAQALGAEQAYARANAAAARPSRAITGTVRSKAGKPLAGICVMASAKVRLRNSAKPLSFTLLDVSRTGKNGTYSVYSFPPGFDLIPVSWHVLFEVGCGNTGNYAPQWWHAKAFETQATTLLAKPHGGTLRNIDATLTEGATMAGVIRAGSGTGAGLPGVCVTADGRGRQAGVSISTRTGTAGRYALRGLGTGTYEVLLGACSSGNYLGKTYGRASTRVRRTTTVDSFLLPGASVTGTVTSTAAGAPAVAGICTTLSNSRGFFADFAVTSSTGKYTFTRLPRGTYFVAFTGGCRNKGSYAPQYYSTSSASGTTSTGAASPIVLATGQRYTASTVMLPGGTLTGTTTTSSGTAIRGICVSPVGATSTGIFNGLGPLVVVAVGQIEAISGKKGHYEIENMAPGRYEIAFQDCEGRSYAGKWYAPEGGLAPQFVSIPGGPATVVSVALQRAGTIDGTVTNAAGHGLPDICVEAAQRGPAEPPPGNELEILLGFGFNSVSGKDGRYTATGLAPGLYTVQFVSCFNRGYGSQVYKRRDPGSAGTVVRVRSGHVTGGINARLTAGKSVTGTIRSGVTHKPVGLACVVVYPGHAAQRSYLWEQLAESARKTGRFVLRHMSPGIYQVLAEPCGRVAGPALAPTWTTIRVPGGSASPVLTVTLPEQGTIRGTVSAPGLPGAAADTCVEATPVTGSGLTSDTEASAAGKYVLSGLAPGTYQVAVLPGCSGSTPLSQQPAITVTVRSGATTAADPVLVADGSITGTVSGGSPAAPVAGICAAAYAGASATAPTAVAITGAGGTYEIGFLAPGSYIVKFSSGCGATGYATQWYDNAGSAAMAKPVSVSAGAETGSVNATLSS